MLLALMNRKMKINPNAWFMYLCVITLEGRYSSVGITTRYGLDGPGVESRWGTKFSAPVPTGFGAHSAGSFPEVKRPERGFDHPPHPALRLKNE